MHRWNRVACAPLLAGLMFVLAPIEADARLECVNGPYWRKVSRTHYVQELKLYCLELPEEPGERIARARALLALCREMGGTQDECNQVLFDEDDPATRTVLDVLRGSGG